jgi:hypothetical protein
MFHERKWPEGYVFPACEPCNQATADDETLFALLCRISPRSTTEQKSLQTLKLLEAIRERQPDVFNTLFRQDVSLPTGPLYPIGRASLARTPVGSPFAVSVDHPEIREQMKRCATKLFLSLHYRHTGKIVPGCGGVIYQWFTNATRLEDVPLNFLELLVTRTSALNWQKVNLDDQFEYRYGIHGGDAAGFASVFIASFHGSMGMTGIVFDDLGHLKDGLSDRLVLQPFRATRGL